MSGARLLGHVVTLTISPINRVNPDVDEDTRRVFHHENRDTNVEVQAQLNWNQDNAREKGFAGADLRTSAPRVIMLRDDCESASYTPANGDWVSKVTDEDGTEKTVSMYMENVRQTAQVRGGYLLWTCDLYDRGPAR